MTKRLAIIHTTPLTIDSLKAIVKEIIPDCVVSNFLDDTILPQLINNGGKVEEVEERWSQYVKYAEQTGAQCILSACSTVGDLVDKVKSQIAVPLLRIDEAMAEKAIEMGDKIGIAATLSTTLNPTVSLLKRKAESANKKKAVFQAVLVEEAFKLINQGDNEGHDRLIINALDKLAKEADVIVLAQASMGRVVAQLPKQYQDKFLSSPRLGIERVKRVFEESAL